MKEEKMTVVRANSTARALLPRALLFTALLLLPASSWAHRLIETDTPPSHHRKAIDINDPSVSQVYYATLERKSPQVWFRFDGRRNQELYFSLGVPVIKRLESFRPRVALLGPGMDPIELPFDLPRRVGGHEYRSVEARRRFHEEFTGTDSWILIEETVRLPRSGTYYLVAYPEPSASRRMHDPAHDKLWLTVGTKERFGLRDLCQFGRWRREVRRFHEVR